MLKLMKNVAIAASVALLGFSAAAQAQVFYMENNASYTKADAAMRAGELEKASKLFKHAIRGPLRGERLLAAYNNLCAVDLARGALEAAEKACSGAIGENRLYWRAYVNRGHVRAQMGKRDLALKDIRKAASLRPQSRLVKRVLAQIEGSATLIAKAN